MLEAFALVFIFVMILLVAFVPNETTQQSITTTQQASETGDFSFTVFVAISVVLMAIAGTTKSRKRHK